MCPKLRSSRCAVALFFLNMIFGTSDVLGQQPPAMQLPEPEVLEQGPMHEAFARSLALDAGASVVTARRPPEPIEELPPEFQPEGNNVQWIPGYFMWAADREDFVWVSGLYRDVPPSRAWVPGAWQEVEGGFQWVPGFWSKGEQQELQFLPTPPDTLEQGPSSTSPGDNHLWAPGCWRWRDRGYAWQPGYWYEAHTNWVWVPSHYNYAPRGCLYVGGYWDYPFARRGLLYAPLFWGRGFDWHAGNYYQPRHALSTALVVASLFVDHHHRYHFGYYGNGRHPDGFHRWGDGRGRTGHHDPQLAHHQWSERQGRGDTDRQQGNVDRGPGGRDQNRLVTDVGKLDRQRRDDMNLRRQGEAEQLVQRKRAEQFRQHSQRRSETKVTAQNKAAGAGQIRRRQELARSETRKGSGPSVERKSPLGSQAKSHAKVSRNRVDRELPNTVKQREAVRTRGEASKRMSRSTNHDPTTVRQQAGGTVQRGNTAQHGSTIQQRSTQQRSTVQRRSPTYQGSGTFGNVAPRNVAPGNVAPRSSNRTTYSQSPQRGRSSVQKSSRQTRSVSPSGGGQRSGRSYQRSGHGGGSKAGGKGGGGRGGGGKSGSKGGGGKGDKGRGH